MCVCTRACVRMCVCVPNLFIVLFIIKDYFQYKHSVSGMFFLNTELLIFMYWYDLHAVE
jgi:hypothetical protein